MNQIVSKHKFYVHSCHIKDDDNNINGIFIKEKILLTYSNGTEEWLDNLAFYKDPKRPFWITKYEHQNHEYKKEFEYEDKLDKYICHDSQLVDLAEKVLNLPVRPFRKRYLRQVCDSPYIYGADIDTETLIRQRYAANQPVGKVVNLSRGGLDIEAVIGDDQRINLITFIHEKTIYTAALKEFCKIEQSDGNYKEASEKDCLDVIYNLLGFYFEKHHFTLEFTIAPTEIELIKWIFDKIHKEKTDYISIWNMKFDIPHIFMRIQQLGYNPIDICCHPEIAKEYKYCEFKEDKSDVQHFTDKWHWTTITGYSQFIDGMCLYARLRKMNGRDSSYSLDAISTKEIGSGKLHFGNITNHQYMQNHRFLEYIAYNINDVIIMQLMELQNNDQIGLLNLVPQSLPRHFNHQTIMVRNNAYVYCKKKNMIIASAGTKMTTEYDEELPKLGGTVLPPNKGIGVYTSVIEEYDYPTQAVSFVNDLDVSSQYPSTIESFNISKQSCLATVLRINGRPFMDVEVFFNGAVSPQVNAVDICNKFYGFPTYEEMEELLAKEKTWYKEKSVV